MKAWITKDALTDGVIEVDNAEKVSEKIIKVEGYRPIYFVNNEDIFFDQCDAIRRAEVMRKNAIRYSKKRISLLLKYIKKLDELSFEK